MNYLRINNQQEIAHKFNKAADNYNLHSALQYNIAMDLLTYCQDDFNLESTIIDLGSGTGYLLDLIKTKDLEYKYLYMLDIAYNMSNITKKKSKTKELSINTDINHLPIANNSANLILSSMTLQWLENLDDIFVNIYNILKSEGKFIATIVGDGSLHELKQSFAQYNLANKINNFMDPKQLEIYLDNLNIKNYKIWQKQYSISYKNTYEILKNIKAIGANYNYKNSNNSYLSKNKLSLIESFYRNNFSTHKNLLPLTWNIIFIEFTKD